MTPAGPDENKREASDQSEANWPQKPVHGSGKRSSAKNKQSEEEEKDDPRDDSPDHGCLGCERGNPISGCFSNVFFAALIICFSTKLG